MYDNVSSFFNVWSISFLNSWSGIVVSVFWMINWFLVSPSSRYDVLMFAYILRTYCGMVSVCVLVMLNHVSLCVSGGYLSFRFSFICCFSSSHVIFVHSHEIDSAFHSVSSLLLSSDTRCFSQSLGYCAFVAFS